MKIILIILLIHIFSSNLFGESRGDGTSYNGYSKKIKSVLKDEKDNNWKITFSSGNSYQGELKEGKYNGLGIFKWYDGRKYEGRFKNGEKNGYGKWISDSGEFFIGEWKNGKKNGLGIFNYKYGSQYVGELENGE